VAESVPRRRLSARARRIREHCVLAVVSVALFAAMLSVVHSKDIIFRLSMATAYTSLALLVVVLIIGPLNVLRGRPNPVSTNLRRDVAIWGGAIGVAHVIVGLNVHLRGHMIDYFIDPKRGALRIDRFGLANYTGLVAGLLLVMLLALSNDLSLRSLGTPRWKSLQRWNYVAMALTVIHGALFELVEKRALAFVAVFGLQVLIALALQLAGYRAVRSGARV
jgi:methionine sulfoxide reductase heme-binding subunit